MWNTALALLFLSVGYMFVSRWIITRSISLRSSENPQYFHAAIAGAAIYIVSSLSVASLKAVAPWLQDIASEVSAALTPQLVIAEPDPTTILRGLRLFVVAAVLAWLLPIILNIPLRKNASLALAMLAKSGAQTNFELLVARASTNLPIMLTQESGKVYVGYVIGEDARTMELGEWIRIEPFLSGFRDERQEFLWNTDYRWLHDDESSERLRGLGREKADFDIVVPTRTIVSAHTFDFPTYAYVFEKRQSEVPDSNEQQSDYQGLNEVNSIASPSTPEATPKSIAGRFQRAANWVSAFRHRQRVQVVFYFAYCILAVGAACLPAFLGGLSFLVCIVAGLLLCIALLPRITATSGGENEKSEGY